MYKTFKVDYVQKANVDKLRNRVNYGYIELVLEQLAKDYSDENIQMLIETLNSNEIEVLKSIVKSVDAGIQDRWMKDIKAKVKVGREAA
tara:strand:+ start:3153 stop:3419 length:267 start_codon:yes stop_codon:yes gene_type:complete